MTTTTGNLTQVDVVHSLYIDLPMLISFLATLEGGVAYSNDLSDTVQRTIKSESETSGDFKLPDVASLAGLSLNLAGKLHKSTEEAQTIESKVVRQHTAASLFNSLRNRLYANTSVYKVRSARDLDRISTGSIIELSGSISESPIQRVIEFFQNIVPFIEMNVQSDLAKIPAVKRNRRDRLTPEEAATLAAVEEVAASMKTMVDDMKKTTDMMNMIEKDLTSSPIVDFVIEGDGVSGFLAANREYLTVELIQGLRGGTFKALGKVTAINSAIDAQAPVVRRGALGALPAETIDQMLTGMRESFDSSGIRMDLPSGQLSGPYVQVIPLAIFV